MREIEFPLSLGFEDIAFQQSKNKCTSRLDVNIESEAIRGVFLKVPLISANMSSVTDAQFAIKMGELGGLGILHRACSEKERVDAVYAIEDHIQWVATSIGIGDLEFDIAKKLICAGCNILVIDIAHGYSDAVFEMCKKIKDYSYYTKIVLGNTTNLNMLIEAEKAGADAVKVGIAQGKACKTKDTAGCTEKQFSAVYKFKEMSRSLGLPVISDGGIRRPADFSLAIAAGANSVMAGSIFARCPESAAEVELIDDKPKKVYSGMASREVQEKWHGQPRDGTCTEGKTIYLDLGESVEKLMERYSGALKSGITYSGGRDIKEFQDVVQFVRFK